MNRIQWDMTKTNFDGVEGLFMGLGAGGHRVAPGQYTLRVRYGEHEKAMPFEILPHPKWKATTAQYTDQQQALKQLRVMIETLQQKANDIRSMRVQMKDMKERIDIEKHLAIHENIDTLVVAIDRMETLMVQPKQKTFQDVINFPNKLEASLLHLYGTIDGIEPPITDGQKERLEDMKQEYEDLMSQIEQLDQDIIDFNNLLIEQRVQWIAPKKKN